MKRTLLSLFILFVAYTTTSPAAEKKAPQESEVTVLARQSSACRRKAMDHRILSLNALKNADAVRGKAHEALVAAMTAGDSKGIDAAREKLDDAAGALEDVIEDVETVVTRTVKADMLARDAESMCKAAMAGKDDAPALDAKKVKSLLASASECLAKAENISKQLRKDWLDPVLATTAVTTSTTSTTKASAAAGGK